METIRSVIGLGSKPEHSKEPVNGETGAGTATDPYDAGNNEEASAAAESASAEPTIASKIAPPVAAVADGTATEPENNIKASETEKSGTAAPLPTTNGVETASSNAIASKESTEVGSGVEAAPAAAVAWIPEPTSAGGAVEPRETVESPTAGEGIAPHETAGSTAPIEGVAPETAQSTAPTEGVAPDKVVGSTPAVATGEKIVSPENTSKATKEPKIGTPSWFKNTIRRKSKTPAASEEKKSTSVVAGSKADVEPIAGTKADVEPIAETKADVVPTAGTKADVESVAESKPTEYDAPSSKTEKAAEIIALPAAAIAAETEQTKKVEPAPVTTSEAKAVAEPKPKKERSLSRDFKLFKNPFKRHSKAGIEEEKAENPSKAPLAGAAAGGAVVGAEAAEVDEKSKDTPATEPVTASAADSVPTSTPEPAAASSEPVATSETVAASEPATEEATAPNHLSADVPPGAAEPAPDQSLPVEEPSAASTAAEETPSKAALDDSIAPAATAATAAPAELDEDIAPDQVAKTDPASDTAGLPETDTPVITEPVDSTADSTADSTVDKGKTTKSSRQAPGENLSAIPTAGGIPLGLKAMEDRQVNQDYRRKSVEPSETDSTAVTTDAAVSKPVDKHADDVISKTVPEAQSATPVEVNGKADVPQRRLSVIDKLKLKLKH